MTNNLRRVTWTIIYHTNSSLSGYESNIVTRSSFGVLRTTYQAHIFAFEDGRAMGFIEIANGDSRQTDWITNAQARVMSLATIKRLCADYLKSIANQ